jgi:hypothetical protein
MALPSPFCYRCTRSSYQLAIRVPELEKSHLGLWEDFCCRSRVVSRCVLTSVSYILSLQNNNFPSD